MCATIHGCADLRRWTPWIVRVSVMKIDRLVVADTTLPSHKPASWAQCQPVWKMTPLPKLVMA